MGAEDTVMNEEQLRELARKEAMLPSVVAKAQAKISFEAGIQVVVDWCQAREHYESNLTWTEEWQAQLKKWGIK